MPGPILLRVLLPLAAGITASPSLLAQQPAPADAVARWRDMRLGMFVHWGPVASTGEEIGWSRGAPTPIEEYDRLYERFDPQQFDADAWVATAKAAGMRYVVLTTKHHDGFCLWPSEFTDYDIANTPFRRDVVRELADACRRQDLRFGTYYSVPDWYHPDYPKGSPAGKTDKPGAQPERYATYLRDQVTELVTRYGPLVTMWFDMPREFGPEYGIPVVDMLRELQPDIVINNRAYTQGDRTGGFNSQRLVGDYDTPEQRVGEFERERPWETCMTICRQWAWKPDDRLKSLAECVNVVIQTIGGDGNLLLNVGPMPDGRIEPRQVERLTELGDWVARHAEGIYGTRGGPYLPGRFGASTCKGNKVFLFVTRWPDAGPLKLPAIDRAITAARILGGDGEPHIERTSEYVTVDVPAGDREAVATVIELTLDAPAFDVPPIAVPVEPSGSLAYGRIARASNTFRGLARYGPAKALDDDPGTRWATDSGTTEAWLEVDLGAPATIGRIGIDEPEEYARVRAFELQVDDDDGWRVVHRGTSIGPDWTVTIAPTTAQRLRVRVLRATDGPTFRELRVFPPERHGPAAPVEGVRR